MNTVAQETNYKPEVTWQDLVEAASKVPGDAPLPVNQDTIPLLARLMADVFGDTLVELEKL